jgi:predicted metal-dependent hydrolase
MAALDPFRQDLESIHPSLRLRISTRARRLALRVDPKTGLINLVMPERASLKKALKFAQDQQSWINRRAAAIPPPIRLTDGTVIPVLGRDRIIRIACDDTFKRTLISLADNEIQVRTNQEDPSMRIVRFLKKLACEEITRLVEEKATSIGKQVAQVQVRDTTSRWGSCSADGRLSFSWRLILAPAEALDYVVAHEVAHLVHMNHKTRFWTLCEKLSVDFKAGHGWMKTHGSTLMRYC